MTHAKTKRHKKIRGGMDSRPSANSSTLKRRKPRKMHFFMHSVKDINGVYSILQNGEINTECDTDYQIASNMNKQWYCNPKVYCHYIFHGMKTGYYDWNWSLYSGTNEPILIIDVNVWKQTTMYALSELSHGDMSKLMFDTTNNKRPDWKTLREHINKKITGARNKDVEYLNSHEILFDTVPASYIRAIIMPADMEKESNKLKSWLKVAGFEKIKVVDCEIVDQQYPDCFKYI